ncbi:MAG: VanZ family protein [Ferruginibacter sp.]
MNTNPAIPVKKFIPAIIWFFVVLTLICLPGNDLPKVDDWFHKINGDKIIHVGVFGLLAFLFFRPVSKSSFSKKEKIIYLVKIAIATSVWGITTEFIQRFYIPARSFDLLDWLADSIGAAVAFIWGRWKMIK